MAGPSVTISDGAALVLPADASGLARPRTLRTAPNGDVFLAESGAGRIRVFHAPDGAERPAKTTVFASGRSQPFGNGFWPPGPEPRFVYVAESSRVVRFPHRLGDLKAQRAGSCRAESPHRRSLDARRAAEADPDYTTRPEVEDTVAVGGIE